MKKLLLFGLMTSIFMIFSGCKDEEDIYENMIIGKWEITKEICFEHGIEKETFTNPREIYSPFSLEFKEGGSVIIGLYVDDTSDEIIYDSWFYRLSGNKINIGAYESDINESTSRTLLINELTTNTIIYTDNTDYPDYYYQCFYKRVK